MSRPFTSAMKGEEGKPKLNFVAIFVILEIEIVIVVKCTTLFVLLIVLNVSLNGKSSVRNAKTLLLPISRFVLFVRPNCLIQSLTKRPRFLKMFKSLRKSRITSLSSTEYFPVSPLSSLTLLLLLILTPLFLLPLLLVLPIPLLPLVPPLRPLRQMNLMILLLESTR